MSSNLYGIPDDFDVVVIGGGPAGATLSALLSERGRRVLVLDRERFPRYHIGESLIPGFMRPMEELKLLDRMEQRGFEKKHGGTLVWGAQKIPWGFSFIEGGPYSYSYHVRRADLDSMILDRSRELGTHVIEEATVKEHIEEDGRVVGVRYSIRGSDEVQEARASLVIDASGQARVLGRKLSNVNWHEDMRNVAVWTYFDNADRLPGDEYTNILIEGLEGGWFWGIPIDKGTMSVGYVTASAAAASSDESLEDLFRAQLGRSTQLKELLKDARQSSGFRSARDWSYTCDRFYGPGWALVGDAAAFVDPLFSTGVALATLAGSSLSKIVDKVLEHPEIEEVALERYATAYRAFFDEIRTFVGKFYDRTRYKEFYWEQAQTIVDPKRERDPREDFVTLVSGLSGRHPLFNIDVDDLIAEHAATAAVGA
ncbi:NAD(P)/FAD-dependent oxidoreductase [Micromonospora sp. NPDC049799]|uniref:NAD(P)/FAD-dependent oxidoreductase n=1 Tax=Micromonospora sp. NPDC049799 TaxID=3154741 RepID=UPI0033D60F38